LCTFEKGKGMKGIKKQDFPPYLGSKEEGVKPCK
jgi:hypothetical protein